MSTDKSGTISPETAPATTANGKKGPTAITTKAKIQLITSYLVTNSACLLSPLFIVVVLIVARHLLFLPTDCSKIPNPRVSSANADSGDAAPTTIEGGNLLFCTTEQWKQKLYSSVAPTLQLIYLPPNETELAQLHLSKERRQSLIDQLNSVYDDTASDLRGTLDDPIPKGDLKKNPDRLAAKAAATKAFGEMVDAREEAIKKLDSMVNAEEERVQTAITAAASEANGRIIWLSYFGLQVIATMGTIVAAIWILAVSIEEQTSAPVPIDGRTKRKHRPGYGYYVLLLIPIVWLSLAIAWAGIEGISRLIFGRWDFVEDEILLLAFLPSIGDNATDLINTHLWSRTAEVVRTGTILTILAAVLLVTAVSSTTAQTPEDVEKRRRPDDTEQKNREYDEFLTRCFERLRIAVYIGGFMLVVCVLQLNARYAWFVSLVPADGEGESLHSTLSATASQLGLSYGLIFTTFLAAVYLPAYVVLRRRAWELARCRACIEAQGSKAAEIAHASSIENLQKWLEARNMGLSYWDIAKQVVTVFAPAGIAIVQGVLEIGE